MREQAGHAPAIVPVLLAGGSGTRLWPVSRTVVPKHLAPLLGRRSLLQETARRLLAFAPAQRVITVGAAAQELLLQRQLAETAAPLADNLLLEPQPRNTAAAIAVAACRALEQWGPDSILLVCPSDHLVSRPEQLEKAVAASLDAAARGRIVTFGIAPSRAETGFGYIAVGRAIDAWPGLHEVREFVEKPARARAEAMLEKGGYLWNAGIFLMQAEVVLRELECHEPAIAEASRRAFAGRGAGSPLRLPAEAYARIPAAPIDKAVMERSARIAVAPCDPGWSDVGSWNALWELAARDAAGNVQGGDVALEEVRDSFVRAEHRLVVLAGVRDLAVVETADALLVAGREASDAIKEAVARLAQEGRPEVARPVTEPRPWGEETRLASRPGYHIREFRITPGARLRFEPDPVLLRLVVAGEGVLPDKRRVGAGELLPVATGRQAEIRNCGASPLVLLEVVPTVAGTDGVP